MHKIVRMLAGGGLAAVLGVSAFGFAAAESPPNPPSRFAGSVLVDGAAPPAGTRIEAKIGNSTCGVTTTFNSGGQSRYTVDVAALDPGASPNCGTDGAVVTFYIGDKKAKETGSWANYQLGQVNLTYVTPPTPTPTGAGGGGGAPTTPRPPATGNLGPQTSNDSSVWLFVALGAGAVAFGAAGLATARRKR